jgi:hypothetical protein
MLFFLLRRGAQNVTRCSIVGYGLLNGWFCRLWFWDGLFNNYFVLINRRSAFHRLDQLLDLFARHF